MPKVKTHFRLPLRFPQPQSQPEPGNETVLYIPDRRETWERWLWLPVAPEVGQRILVYPDYDVAVEKVVVELDAEPDEDDPRITDIRYVAYLESVLPGSVVPGGGVRDAGENAYLTYLAAHDWERIDPPEPILTNDDRRILGLSADHIRTEVDEMASWELERRVADLGGTITRLPDEDGEPIWHVVAPGFDASGPAPALLADLPDLDDEEQRHAGHKIYVSSVMSAGYIQVGAVTDTRPLVRLEWERFGCDEARELAAELILHADHAEEGSQF